MISRDQSGSLKNFPPDLFLLSGLPFLAIALFSSWLFGLRGDEWIIAYASAFLVSAVGGTLLFFAKLPLYREGIYFSFGSRSLPDRMRVSYRRGMILSLTGIIFSASLIGASFLWR